MKKRVSPRRRVCFRTCSCACLSSCAGVLLIVGCGLVSLSSSGVSGGGAGLGTRGSMTCTVARLWGESLHHPGWGGCLLVLCLSVFVSVCLWVCGGAGAGGGWVPARAVSVCLRVCLPASVWLCAQSLKVLGSVLRHPWEKCWGSPWDIWGESPHKPEGSFGNCLGNPSQNCEKGLGRP